MNATYTTVAGRLATAVDRLEFASGATRVTFRVASTERRYDRATEGWGDVGTLYITVKCWRQLGDNVQKSLRIGDPVIVYGRLHTRTFERDGRRESMIEMDADAVGPDLRWATAAVIRTKSAAADGAPGTEGTAGSEVQRDVAPPGNSWDSAGRGGTEPQGDRPRVPAARGGSDGATAPAEGAVRA